MGDSSNVSSCIEIPEKHHKRMMYIVEIVARSLIPQVWENLGVKETLILHDCVSNQQRRTSFLNMGSFQQ